MMNAKKIIFLLFVLFSGRCVNLPAEDVIPEESLRISMANFIAVYKSQNPIQFIDVRTQAEYNEKHIAGVKLVDVNTIKTNGEAALTPRNLDKNKTVYIICRTGNRSLTAAKLLKNFGFKNPLSVDGGIVAWESAGEAVVN